MAKNGKGRPTKEQARMRALVHKWDGHIAQYERTFSKWESRAEKIIRRYKDDQGATARNTTAAKYNILWSNVQTLQAATYAKIPKPDVSRRFNDNDPVGRVASLILERALDYEIQHYKDYDFALSASVLDRFLGGRGTAWVRYEPHIKAQEQDLPVDGLQVTEDVDEPQEELDYECAPIDYVHWKDYGHVVSRTWDECPGVWRKVYLSEEAAERRFDKKLPMDSIPEEFKREQNATPAADQYRALVYEIWDKDTKTALWLSKSLGEILDERDDPLGLEEFFPCPKPLFATLTNESLVPVPDFTLYQDQARELDTLCDRIDGLVKALQVKGCYDASIPALGRLFTEGENTNLIPVKNWAAFAEKQGLKGAIDIMDLKPIYEALQAAYLAMDQIKQQVYEITGISDIVRGQGEANATATAERIKGQYASIRLKSYQKEVAKYAAEAIQIKAQVICNKFSPDTILRISAADQLSQQDQQLVPKALELLLGQRAVKGPHGQPLNPDAETPNPMRSFRIEIESDSLVYLDDEENKKSRMEFLQAQGQFIGNMEKMILSAGPLGAALVPTLMEMWKFSAQAFKVGKSIEGSIDTATQKIQQMIAQQQAQPPQPNPEMVKVQQEAKAEQGRQQLEMQKAAAEEQRMVREEQTKAALEDRRMQMENASKNFQAQADMDFRKWEAELDARTKIEIAEISAKATLDAAQMKAAREGVQ